MNKITMANKHLIDAIKQSYQTLKLCPQTSAVVMTLLLIEEVLDKYNEGNDYEPH